ncbi:MAG TPA: XRE family transcriptional regulator [Pyrinomonadaceae bacterium]|jgi:Zn-dependent peptidase ImmA (M78 family)|nr:XRE family transcriptional regulator [Pyrinomonadaceae bacterium]
MATELAYITPKVLGWALDRSSESVATIIKRLNVTEGQLIAWRKGDTHPQFNKAIKLAKILNVPFGSLFLSDPPRSEPPIPDRRTLPNSVSREPSPNFRDLLNEVLVRQSWYREYAVQEEGTLPLPFVGSFSVNGAKPVAASVTKTLGINNDLRKTARDRDHYLTLLSAKAEEAGILVMRSSIVGNNTRRPLSVQEFQGFAIVDAIAPLVFVNTADFKTAQIFTFAHELAHIWIGDSSIDKPDETGTEPINVARTIEEFCNRVAAEILVPEADFQQVYRAPINLPQLARYFWVSTFVILHRAYDLKKLDYDAFSRLLRQEKGKISRATSGSGGTFYPTLTTRLGHKFPEALARDVKHGGTLYRDAAHLLGVKVPTVTKIVERLT